MSSFYVVDDEMINVSIVTKLMSKHYPNFRSLGFSNTIEGLSQKLILLQPDILFLDVNLGKHEIFEIFSDFHCDSKIIFISSDPKYAVEAFKYNAVHFILKPIIHDSFIDAVERAQTKPEQGDFFKKSHWDELKKRELSERFLVVSSLDKHEILKINDILFCKAEGKCTLFSLVNGRNIYSYKNLMEYEYLTEKHHNFIRVNRTYIINFEFVSRVVKKVGVYCEFMNGAMVPVSRRKLDDFNRFLKYIE